MFHLVCKKYIVFIYIYDGFILFIAGHVQGHYQKGSHDA